MHPWIDHPSLHACVGCPALSWFMKCIQIRFQHGARYHVAWAISTETLGIGLRANMVQTVGVCGFRADMPFSIQTMVRSEIRSLPTGKDGNKALGLNVDRVKYAPLSLKYEYAVSTTDTHTNKGPVLGLSYALAAAAIAMCAMAVWGMSCSRAIWRPFAHIRCPLSRCMFQVLFRFDNRVCTGAGIWSSEHSSGSENVLFDS